MVERGSVGVDNRRVDVNVGRWEFVEQVACIAEVAEASGAEADELEGVEVSVAMPERDEMRLELLEVIKVAAFVEDRANMLVEAARRNHVMFLHYKVLIEFDYI